MRNGARPDSEYGFRLYLKDDREFPVGHELTDLPDKPTDVNMLKQIIDSYMDLSSDETLKEFSDYKLDFSENYLDSLYLIYKEKFEEAGKLLDELDKQESDMSHQIIKPVLTNGKPMSDEDKVRIFNELEQMYIKRRWVKKYFSGDAGIDGTCRENQKLCTRYEQA